MTGVCTPLCAAAVDGTARIFRAAIARGAATARGVASRVAEDYSRSAVIPFKSAVAFPAGAVAEAMGRGL